MDSDREKRTAYEQLVRSLLLGRRIESVRYYEIEYEQGYVGWRAHPEVGHFLDHGLDFRMADGSECNFTWDAAFNQFDIAVRSGSLRDELTAFHVFDVTNVEPWITVARHPISRVEIYWSWCDWTTGERSERRYFPEDIELFFGEEVVLICCRQYIPESDALFGMSDEVAVVFDLDTARRYRVGSFERESGLPNTPFHLTAASGRK